MKLLPLSCNEYNKSVLLTGFISEIKKMSEESPYITDIIFRPVIKGYEISFKENGSSVRLSLKVCRNLSDKAYTIKIKVFSGNKLKKAFKAGNAVEAIAVIKSVLTK